MDVKDYLSILRLHSDYLRTLAAQLDIQFADIEQTLQDQDSMTYAEAGPHVDSLIKCSTLLVSTAESFHQRLVAFRKKTQREQAPIPPYDPRSSSLDDDSAK
jgi:hypothetical protein